MLGLQFYFFGERSLDKDQFFIFQRVFVDIFGNAHIVQTILADFFHFAATPPSHGFQPVAAFVNVECALGDLVQFHAPAVGVFNFAQNVQRADFGQVATAGFFVIFVEQRNVEMVAVVGDEHVGFFQQ